MQQITLMKVGDGIAEWSTKCDDAWIVVSPSYGILTEDNCTLLVTANALGLKAGEYKSNLEFLNATNKTNKAVLPVSLVITLPPPPVPAKESVPDESYVQVSADVGYYVGTGGRSCLYMISVHNKHDKWSIANVKLKLENGKLYDIADIIGPFDTATFNRPSLPCSRYTIIWTWKPPASPKL